MNIKMMACALVILCLAPNWAPEEGDYLSPLSVVADSGNKRCYISCATANRILVFDGEKDVVLDSILMPEPPKDLLLSRDNARLFVTNQAPEGKVYEIDLKQKKVMRTIGVGHTPTGMAMDGAHGRAYVCNRFDNDVSFVDLKSNKTVFRQKTTREPIGCVLSGDGKFLFVANHLPSGPSDGLVAGAEVTVVDVRSDKADKKLRSIFLPNGSTGVRGICLSNDGKYVFVTHILARYHLPTTQLERGWMNTNALSIIDVERLSLLNTVLLDDVDLGAANPWGVACSEDNNYVVVGHGGSHCLNIINQKALIEKLKGLDAKKAKEVPNDLAFLVGLKRRVGCQGRCIRGVAIMGDRVFGAEYYSDSLAVAELKRPNNRQANSLALGEKHELSQERLGELYFNDATLCFQEWQSCSSCHPDGRVDGLNWDLLNDGFGNPKNTKSLLLSHETPPVMVTGARKDAEAAVRSGIRFIQFAVRSEEDAKAIDSYLRAMKPVPSPYLVNGKLSEKAMRGEKIFLKAGCAACHKGSHFTDLNTYKIGLGKGLDKDKLFDTPTLVEIWRTRPYLYDGRAEDMGSVLGRHNKEDKHGKTSMLTQEELEVLTEYVLSL